jgi:hypothetical protein
MASKKKTAKVKVTDLIAAEMAIAAPLPPAPEPPKPKLVNRIALVLDDSGSMSSCYRTAVDQINKQIAAIKVKAQQTGQETYVSFYLFGGGGIVRNVYHNRLAAQVEPVRYDFASGPQTPLIDAIGTAITDGLNGPGADDVNTSFLVIVATDGEETGASRIFGNRYNTDPLVKLISRAQNTDRWTLVVLTPNGYEETAARYGIPRANIMGWENTVRGAEQAFNRTAVAMNYYYEARSAGQKSTKSFYTTDLSSLKKADLSKMTDVSGRFKRWTVDREVDITAFVESKGVKFVVGAGYYQFTKKELLRNGRTLLIREKNTNRVFGGKDARTILGIPDGEVQVTPGNHANFDLFMQSTSNNRKLVRGTEFYYDLLHQPGMSEQTWDWQAAKAAADAKAAQQTT